MPSKDFKSNQIRLTKLIASGAMTGGGISTSNNVGIAIYSASNASDTAGGIKDVKLFDKVGPDVMLVVSGNIGGTNATTGFGPDSNEPGGITLFTGDVYVSGNLGVAGTSGQWTRDAAGWIYPTTTTDSVYIGGANAGNAHTLIDDEGNLTFNAQ